MALRHVLSILLLPGTVAVVVPIWIARQNQTVLALPQDAAAAAAMLAGLLLLGVGLTLFTVSLFHFWTRGRGTLAPWDPPRQFVVTGPYRFVRNPMISGVIFVLLGEAGILRSVAHLEWALLFALINAIYIPAIEEPMLAARFGEPYRKYCLAVRRFVPRLRPWIRD